jgi:uncharacterized damage-inducible protein DinB
MKTILAATLFCAATTFAQDASLADAKMLLGMVKGNIMKSAEKMPEDKYSFKPTEGVRTFGQLLGHIADSQYFFCNAVGTEKKQSGGVEKNAKTKAELVAGLKAAFEHCEASIAAAEGKGAEKVKFFRGEWSRVGVLGFNNAHLYEHYGNLVTYMRINGIVPPSSEGN